VLSIHSHQKLLDNFFEQKSKGTLHHSFILRINDTILLDSLIGSVCNLILGIQISDYTESPYVTVANIENDEVKVAEVKKIIKRCELSGHNNLAKIIIIEELDNLNDSAVNALLKTLEEPSDKTFFLMFTKNYKNILDTVKSRSLVFDVQFTDLDKKNYLQYTFDMSQDVIDKSLKMARNDVNIIAKIKLEPNFWKIRVSLFKALVNQVDLNSFLKESSPNFYDVLYWLNSTIIDIYNFKISENEDNLANYDKLAVIKYLANKLSDDKIYEIYQQSLDSKNYFMNFKNVDRELILENLMLEIIR
jgi:DNA polymerase-3 subunit delta'